MELYDAEAVARLNRLGRLARERIKQAIDASGAPASVTGAGSLFRIHFQAEPPTDYRGLFPTPAQRKAQVRFIDGMYDNGIVLVHSGAGTLSTPMGESEIDVLAEAVEKSLRLIKDDLTE